MSYWLGIDVGTTFTAAAVCRREAGRVGVPEVVGLGTRSAAVSSVLFVAPDGQVVVGEAAERRAVTDPDRVVREFKRRIGDEVPMVVGGRAHGAAEIAALVLGWVVERVAAREGGPAAGIVVTHPAGWGPYKISTMMAAVRAAGLASVTFCTEPEAAAAGYAVAERVESGSTIAVYDLGGGTFDAAVVRKTGVASWQALGVPQGLEAVGGADFDDAIMGHVLAAVPALAGLDGQDPAVLAAMVALRRECTEAKEALSSDTEVTIPVLAPGVAAQVRLVRAEFEEMIRPLVVQTVEALRRAVRSAQIEPGDLDAVLLVGGSSRVPLVAQLVSAELGRPVAIDADPKAAIALGAALCALPTPAADVASNAPDAASPIAVPEPETPALNGMQAPQRPSLTAIPLDVEPAALQLRRTRSRLVKRVAVAGALSLLAAGGVAGVPLLTSQSGPVPQAAAGTPAPAPAIPPASTSISSDNSLPSGAASNPVLAVPVTASTRPASAATKPAAVRAQPAGLQTVGSTRPPAPTPSPSIPAPIGAGAAGASGGSTVDPPANSTGSSTTDGGGKTGGNTTDGGGKTGGGKTGGSTTGGGNTGGSTSGGGTTGGGTTGGGTTGGGTTGGGTTGGGTTGGGSTTTGGGGDTGGTSGTGAGTPPSGSAPAAQHT